jgi:hypothetical protein
MIVTSEIEKPMNWYLHLLRFVWFDAKVGQNKFGCPKNLTDV